MIDLFKVPNKIVHKPTCRARSRLTLNPRDGIYRQGYSETRR